MKVRLKHKEYRTTEQNYLKFQFHEGPIKTLNIKIKPSKKNLFQFHEGPIKTAKHKDKKEQQDFVSIPWRSD